MSPDEKFMLRAIELAQRGAGQVSPNPMVGCVITCDQEIIGEGWHTQYGQPHAEAMALASIQDTVPLNKATLYVNLEPCNHTGKTPPCTDTILKRGIGRVVVANKDTNPAVTGGGLKKLSDAGVETVSGVLEKNGRELNKRFFTCKEKMRPYITLKWAQTKDGFIARSNYESKWISEEPARKLVHQMRSREDAVLVGTRTALHDNPELTVRLCEGRNPVRIVIDRALTLPKDLHLFDGNEHTIIYSLLENKPLPNVTTVTLNDDDFLTGMMQDLIGRNITAVLIEGGAYTLQQFIQQNLWDEAHIVTGNKHFGEGIKAPLLSASLVSDQEIGSDRWQVFKNGVGV